MCILISVTYDLKRTFASSAFKKLTDSDNETCVKLSLTTTLPPFKVNFYVDNWISTAVKIHVYHRIFMLQSSDWLSAYANTSGPHPTTSVILRRMCQLVMSASDVTEILCICVFPCHITVELSFLMVRELDLCELKLDAAII